MEKVSFILTTYNSGSYFENTIQSILEQDYPDIEIVVKDGGSTDGTLDIIRKYAEQLKERFIWMSRKDDGIYDAMNQGYQQSSGDIVIFFNDVLMRKDAVTLMVEAIRKGGEKCEGAHADLIYADGERIVRRWRMGKGYFRQGWMPGHPTLFVKRSVYERYGLYDTQYKCSADYEFMLRAFYGREDCLAYVPQTIVKMFYGGTSTGGLENYLVSLKEGHAALKKNHVRGALWIDIRRTCKVLLQFIR